MIDHHVIETLARRIAEEAHAGQVDKLGEPYIGHVSRVAGRLEDPLDRAVAWLHDVVEDTSWSASQLLWRGQDELGSRGKKTQTWVDVLACVRALTHRPNEFRERYYIRIKAAGPRAVRVKLADIADKHGPSTPRPARQRDTGTARGEVPEGTGSARSGGADVKCPACDSETSESGGCRVCEGDYCLVCGWGCDFEVGGDHYEESRH